MGIGNIIMCMTSVKEAGGQLKLAAVAEKIIDTLALMEIDQLFVLIARIEFLLIRY